MTPAGSGQARGMPPELEQASATPCEMALARARHSEVPMPVLQISMVETAAKGTLGVSEWGMAMRDTLAPDPAAQFVWAVGEATPCAKEQEMVLHDATAMGREMQCISAQEAVTPSATEQATETPNAEARELATPSATVTVTAMPRSVP